MLRNLARYAAFAGFPWVQCRGTGRRCRSDWSAGAHPLRGFALLPVRGVPAAYCGPIRPLNSAKPHRWVQTRGRSAHGTGAMRERVASRVPREGTASDAPPRRVLVVAHRPLILEAKRAIPPFARSGAFGACDLVADCDQTAGGYPVHQEELVTGAVPGPSQLRLLSPAPCRCTPEGHGRDQPVKTSEAHGFVQPASESVESRNCGEAQRQRQQNVCLHVRTMFAAVSDLPAPSARASVANCGIANHAFTSIAMTPPLLVSDDSPFVATML